MLQKVFFFLIMPDLTNEFQHAENLVKCTLNYGTLKQKEFGQPSNTAAEMATLTPWNFL